MAEPEPIRRADEHVEPAQIGEAPRQESVGDLVRELTSDIGDLMQAELRLARRELVSDIGTMARGAVFMAVGGVVLLLALVYLLLAAVFALATTMPSWLAALIVGIVALVIGGIAAAVGIGSLKSVNPMPEQTMRNVREDVTWLRNRMR